MKLSRGGFTVAEALPAMLLLMLAVWVSSRFIWMSLESRHAGWRFRERRAALEAVESGWANSGELAAVAIRGEAGRWDVVYVPDAEWLPETPAEHRGLPATYLFIREDRLLSGMCRVMETRSLVNGVDGSPRWQVMNRILIPVGGK